MVPKNTLLDVLRSRTTVDCDTLDASVAESLGPFEDCTSNQAIACFELQQHRHLDLVKRSLATARELSSKYPGIPAETLAVEIGMISLGFHVVHFLKGCMYVQTDPYDAYSTARTIIGAERIVSLFEHFQPQFNTSRICIKIPSTWEGLQACRTIEQKGIKTLAATLFTMEQAALAGEAGCSYIAPYQDLHPNLELCTEAQAYCEQHSLRTQVLPASLVSIKECMALAGANHLTIAPPLLQQLSETTDADVATNFPSLFDRRSAPLSSSDSSLPKMSYINDEDGFRIALTRRNGGAEEVKLIQAINIFCDMQLKLEGMMKGLMEKS